MRGHETHAASSATTTPASDLTGQWQTPGDDPEQVAKITNRTIIIIWNANNGKDRSICWAGSFDPPTKPGTYAWVSTKDAEKSGSGLAVSSDDTITFTYKNKHITYTAATLGKRRTMTFSRAA